MNDININHLFVDIATALGGKLTDYVSQYRTTAKITLPSGAKILLLTDTYQTGDRIEASLSGVRSADKRHSVHVHEMTRHHRGGSIPGSEQITFARTRSAKAIAADINRKLIPFIEWCYPQMVERLEKDIASENAREETRKALKAAFPKLGLTHGDESGFYIEGTHNRINVRLRHDGTASVTMEVNRTDDPITTINRMIEASQ